MNRERRLAVAALAALGVVMAPGLVSGLVGQGVKIANLELRDTKLDNGLRVILVPDHSAPVYAINVTYNVGSRNEHPGRTGFAHLFEHMMFQGSANVGKGEHFILVLNNGGNMHGTTSEDRTLYFEELPKNQLYGRAQLDLDSLPYDNFAYKHPTIGSMADLNAANVSDVAAFFHTYYA